MRAAPTTEYLPFPDEEGRNTRQAQLAIPAMVRAPAIPSGARTPEVAAAKIARVLAADGTFVHETRVSQLLSHPVRSRGRHLPPLAADGPRQRRWAMLWASRTKAPRR